MDNISNRNYQASLSFPKLLLRCLAFLGIFCVISAVLILIFSAAFYNTSDPISKVSVASFASLYLATFISSFILTKMNKEKWLFGGLFLGFFIYMLTLMLAFLVDEPSNVENIAFRLLILLISVLSAFLARKREPKKIKFKMKNLH